MLAISPISALSIFNIYRRSFGVELSASLQSVESVFESLIHQFVNAGPKLIFGFTPPQLLTDMWIFSLWWTGVMASSTVAAMRDKGATPPWHSQLVMVPFRLFLGYSLMGFFIAATVVPLAFVRLKTGDEDLDRYGHWVRVFSLTCIALVAALFCFNEFA